MTQISDADYMMAMVIGGALSPYTLGPAQILVVPSLVIAGVAAGVFKAQSTWHNYFLERMQSQVGKLPQDSAERAELCKKSGRSAKELNGG